MKHRLLTLVATAVIVSLLTVGGVLGALFRGGVASADQSLQTELINFSQNTANNEAGGRVVCRAGQFFQVNVKRVMVAADNKVFLFVEGQYVGAFSISPDGSGKLRLTGSSTPQCTPGTVVQIVDSPSTGNLDLRGTLR